MTVALAKVTKVSGGFRVFIPRALVEEGGLSEVERVLIRAGKEGGVEVIGIQEGNDLEGVVRRYTTEPD